MAICWLVYGAVAQETDSLKVEQLEEVTIKAVRAGKNAPVSQVTIGKKEIEEVYQGQDGAFLLEQISPSIVSTSESGTNLGNYGSFRLRGIDQTRVNLTLNGVPLNDMLGQGVFFSNFIDFGNSVESVQIQRGVGTSTNGVASYAGSINFESVSLTGNRSSAEMQLTTGSFGTIRSSAEVKTGLMKNRTSFYARVSQIKSDGYRYNTGTNSKSLFFSGGYFGEKHALKFTGFAGQSRNELAYAAVPLALIQEDPRTNLVSPNDEDDFEQWLFQLQHTYRLAARTSVVSTIYYGGAGGDFFVSLPPDSAGAVSQLNFPLYNDHIGLMSFVDHENGRGNFELNAGVHAYRFIRNNQEYFVPLQTDPYYDDRSYKDEISGFAKASFRSGEIELYGDVQVRAVRISFEPDEQFIGQAVAIPNRNYLFINPKIGATYSLNDQWQAYVSFGRSGREPTRTDILRGFSLSAANLDLALDVDAVDPEYVNDLEIGWRYRSTALSFALNYFYMNFENEIAPAGQPLAFGQFVRYNQNSSYRTGLELTGQWKVAPRLNFETQATWLRARISSYSPPDTTLVYNDVSPILSPEWNLRGTLSYELIDGLDLRLTARYLSSSFLELSNNLALIVPESLVFNARLNWRFWREHELNLQVNNLSDELYYTAGQPTAEGPAYFVQPPRHFFVTLNLKF